MRWAWLENLARLWRPYPICMFGVIYGWVRKETHGGGDIYPVKNAIYLFEGPKLYPIAATPFAVTHLQKRSRFGFLFMWPFCFHVWFTFKYQEQDAKSNWIPGTEKVLYYRVGVARWDAGDSIYICPTWYGPGLHWD